MEPKITSIDQITLIDGPSRHGRHEQHIQELKELHRIMDALKRNEDRSRWYGIRIGDTVRDKYTPGPAYEVTDLDRTDNNRVWVSVNGKPHSVVAEWQTIITKVESKVTSHGSR